MVIDADSQDSGSVIGERGFGCAGDVEFLYFCEKVGNDVVGVGGIEQASSQEICC